MNIDKCTTCGGNNTSMVSADDCYCHDCKKYYVVCECHACIEEFHIKSGESDDFFDQLSLSVTKMILCPDCGNKRCPKASDHRLACTGSNEPGQTGSIYIATN